MTAHASASHGLFDGARGAAPVVGKLHVLLSLTVVISFLADALTLNDYSDYTWLVFLLFVLYNVGIYTVAGNDGPPSERRAVLWLEACWYSVIVYATGGGASLFFPFYIFTILIASFRFGFGEGSRITLASVAMFGLTAAGTQDTAETMQIALRSGFLLGIGHLLAMWGEANLAQQRNLALMRDIGSLANPRFGIDRTIAAVMERGRAHFGADACVLVASRPRSQRCVMRIARGAGADEDLPAMVGGGPLRGMANVGVVLYRCAPVRWTRGAGQLRSWDSERDSWRNCDARDGQMVAELCGARSFISVPLSLCPAAGRIYMLSARRSYREADALFLRQLVAQVVPVLENIHLLDHLASRAALRERRTIAHDLHDRTVQPYIGLSHTLAALRRKATADNPLTPDIDELAAMTAEVVAELREFAGGFARKDHRADLLLHGALRRRLQHVRQFYHIDIALEIDGAARLGDRLAAQVLQLAQEGINNICKHTEASRGALRVRCAERQVTLEIENDCAAPAPNFVPASIAGRSAELGGSARVEHLPGATLVLIEIPA